MHISIGGFPSGTSEAEIREPLEALGVKVLDVTIKTSESDDRYVAIIDLDTDEAGCKYLANRMNGRMWHGQTLVARVHLFGK